MRVLVVPDKFKGTLAAAEVCAVIAKGWKSARPMDELTLLPMSDGGDGFGPVMGSLFHARLRSVRTVDAAHRPIAAKWWWEPRAKLAVIEAARVIGVAMLPPGKFHPFQLDTFGLGRVLKDAFKLGARHVVVGIGGSATNDAGFGLARALGWRFLDASGGEIEQWWQLNRLVRAESPTAFKRNRGRGQEEGRGRTITVAVDVSNPLLGARGCTRVYGPQKGLRPEDLAYAEKCLRRLKQVWAKQTGIEVANVPGAGAAGGLGFGLMAFAGANARSGFEVFAEAARLDEQVRAADLVITGEGAVDRQTFMGKGVGRVAELCAQHRVPCVALAGTVSVSAEGNDSSRRRLQSRVVLAGMVSPEAKKKNLFSAAFGLTEITGLKNALKRPGYHLEKLSTIVAAEKSWW